MITSLKTTARPPAKVVRGSAHLLPRVGAEPLVICAALSATLICPPGTTAQKPNVVIFQPDDYPHYWSDAPQAPPGSPASETERNPTPNLDRIRSEGVIFSRAYAASALCAPSRFSILTGRYASHSKIGQLKTSKCDSDWTVTDVSVPKCKIDDEFDQTNNLPMALRDEGYRTGVVGKWHASLEGQDPWGEYSEQTQKARDTGMDFVDGFYIANIDNGEEKNFSHNQEWVTAKGLEFMEQAVQDNTPFFLYFNPTLPHAPSAVEALNNYSIRQTPSGTLDQDPASNMPSRDDVLARAAATGAVSDRSVGAIVVDDAAGALYDKLEELGVLDNTLFIFIMDHGIVGKSTLYESGARIAMFARFPEGTIAVQSGAVYHNLVSHIDLAPTILHLASGTDPSSTAFMDGKSILAQTLYASEEEARWSDDRALVVEISVDRAVVTQQWKYIVTDLETWEEDNSCKEPKEFAALSRYPFSSQLEQVYNLSSDPTEQINLVDSAAAAIVDALRAVMQCHLNATAIGQTPVHGQCSSAQLVSEGDQELSTTPTVVTDTLSASADGFVNKPITAQTDWVGEWRKLVVTNTLAQNKRAAVIEFHALPAANAIIAATLRLNRLKYQIAACSSFEYRLLAGSGAVEDASFGGWTPFTDPLVAHTFDFPAPSNGAIQVDVTDLAIAALADSGGTVLSMMLAANEDCQSVFASSEHENDAKRPQLTVVYAACENGYALDDDGQCRTSRRRGSTASLHKSTSSTSAGLVQSVDEPILIAVAGSRRSGQDSELTLAALIAMVSVPAVALLLAVARRRSTKHRQSKALALGLTVEHEGGPCPSPCTLQGPAGLSGGEGEACKSPAALRSGAGSWRGLRAQADLSAV